MKAFLAISWVFRSVGELETFSYSFLIEKREKSFPKEEKATLNTNCSNHFWPFSLIIFTNYHFSGHPILGIFLSCNLKSWGKKLSFGVPSKKWKYAIEINYSLDISDLSGGFEAYYRGYHLSWVYRKAQKIAWTEAAFSHRTKK